MRDSLGTRPPAGTDSPAPSTFWLDRTLVRLARSDGSNVELSSGDVSRLLLEDGVVTATADYDTFDDQSVDAVLFLGLVQSWRDEVLASSTRKSNSYVADFPTRAATHATLRIFCPDIEPTAISHLLGSEPSRTLRKGDPVGRTGAPCAVNGWLLSSEHHVQSRDLRRHIDWLLDQVNEMELLGLQVERSAEVDVFCFWKSQSGQGGPEIDPAQMCRLAKVNASLVFDCYAPD